LYVILNLKFLKDIKTKFYKFKDTPSVLPKKKDIPSATNYMKKKIIPNYRKGKSYLSTKELFPKANQIRHCGEKDDENIAINVVVVLST
jgi:hypothetical protein